jgi:hypothetical protein
MLSPWLLLRLALAGGRRYGGGVSAGTLTASTKMDALKSSRQQVGSRHSSRTSQGRSFLLIWRLAVRGVQHITFEINTTGGIDDATMAKMAQMMKQVSLNTIRDQQRPNGLLRR